MADTTSVGTIQLDVEINPQSLNAEMSKLGKAFSTSFNNMFSGMVGQANNFIRNSIGKMAGSFKSFAQSGTSSSEKVSQSVSKMNSQYDKTQAKIREINAELAKLYAKQDAIAASYANMPAFSGMAKGESIQKMLGADTEYQKLAAEIEKLEAKLGPLNAKNRELSGAIRQSGDAAQGTGKKMKNMGNAAQGTSGKLSQLGSIIKKVTMSMFGLNWIKRIFSRETNKATNAASNFGNTMSRVSRMIARNLIVYGLIIKGLKSMISYTWSALKTNQQFAHSLNVIKTNLLVAFQPIYEFVLPALNALMQAIATVTTYIAAAISALFGKTYKQSFDAAKSMNTAIENMDGIGNAAGKAGKKVKKAGDEAKRALAPFDELNILDFGKDETPDIPDVGGGGGAGGFEMTMPDLATIDMSGINKFKEIMSKIFEPFKKAWENEGQATIDAMKYALTGVWDLVKEIGKSWLEVWTNGTGQAMLETMLRILQNIFNTVGNLAIAFKNAWNENEVGTRIIQGIFDIFNIILETIEKITSATAEWAKTLDFSPLLESISKLLESLKPLTQNIGDGLAWLWENALLPIASWTIEDALPVFLEILAAALEVLNNIIEALKPLGQWLWDSFLQPLASWTGGIIIQVLEGIRDGLKAIGDWIKDHQAVIESMAIIIGSFAAAWGLVNAAMAIWNVVGAIATGVTSAFGAAVAFLTSPIGLVTAAIGAVIAIGTLLYKHWDEISAWIKDLWQGIKDKAEEIWNGIKDFFAKLWEGITTALTEAWNAISEFISGTWDSIKTKAEEIWNGIKTFLTDKIWNPIKNTAKTIWEGIEKVIIDPIKSAWTWLKDIWTNIKEFILGKWDEIKTGISNKKDALIGAIKEPFNIATDFIGNIIKGAKDWGKNLIGNFIDGIKSMIGKVKDAVNSVVNTVKDFLGFSSPAKKGPGKDADKWMPNLMDMLASGIEDNIAEVSAAISLTAGTIQQVQPSADDMASAVGNAVLQSMRTAQADMGSSGDTSGDIVLKIGETEFGRIAIKSINMEQRRVGKTLILV